MIRINKYTNNNYAIQRQVDVERLKNLRDLVGKERIVIDLSCRKKSGQEDSLYYVVTNKWTQYTNYSVT
jgi:phosphoribosylformimino-5-aminoimidazole carboxamide ribotide isomerase